MSESGADKGLTVVIGAPSDYPFAALVGQDQLRTALLLNAIDPAIGGVLIRGEKGTAKSTAARALAALLPPLRFVAGCPFHCDPDNPYRVCPHCEGRDAHAVEERPVPLVDLPLGATEDRVLGTLDFERALREGRRAFQPGLLAAAHRGILYIDEVNLLADHLVDVLLDAAAMGVNTVEREGIAITHPARFLLIGTMNPEEGDLRPQLLDRFGLMVTVAGPRDPEVRAEVVRRRLAFDEDPIGFARRWEAEQAALRQRIVTAGALLPRVALAEDLLRFITQLCCEVGVDGLRADLAIYRTVRALAALDGRPETTLADVRGAAELVLPHRRRRRPFEQPELDRQQLDELFAQRPQEQSTQRSSAEGSSPNRDQQPGQEGESVLPAGSPTAPRRIEVLTDKAAQAVGRGRRNPAPARGHGQYVRAVPDPAPTDLALDATLRAAALHGLTAEGGPKVERADLHRKDRTGHVGTLILFVVDASGSMAARRRMEAVKGAVLGLLQDAYEQRDQVSVIAFRGPAAQVLLPPTDSVELAERALRELPTGGRTPLAHALVLTRESAQRARRSHPERPVFVVLLSDGKANVSLPETEDDAREQALQAAAELPAVGAATLVLDTETGFIRSGQASCLAAAMGAECLPLEDLSAESLLLKVRARRGLVAERR